MFVGNSTSLGAGDIHFNPGTSNNAHMVLGSGTTSVTVANDIYLDTIRGIAGGNGAIMAGFYTTGNGGTNNDVSATVNGNIFVNSASLSGGTFNGAMPSMNSGATGNNITTNFLTLNGAIVFNSTTSSPKGTNGGGGNIIIHRGGNIRYASAGSSYYRNELRAGIMQVGENNGLATNAYIDLGGNSNNNPNAYAIVDLNGFNQSLLGLSNYISQGNPATVTNTSTTTASTLTLAPPNPTSNPNQSNLWLTAGGGAGGAVGTTTNITNVSPSAPLNLTINGDAAGTQYITTAANSYTGATTLTSGTLAISSLADGGVTTNMVTTTDSAVATVDSTVGLAAGQYVVGPGVRTHAFNGAGGTTILSVDGPNQITLSIPATAGDGVTPSLSAFGAGNGLGISSNSASNLVFDGGKLSYVRGVPGAATTNNTPVNFTGTSATPSTNRNFTINSGKSGTIDVQNGTNVPTTTTLTMSGGSANTNGGLIKSGPGTLILTGANQHTGGTTVSAGSLLVNGPGSLSTGTVTVSSGATLGGNGTIAGTVSPAAGGIIAPGASVGTLTVGGLTLNSGSFVDFEFGTGNDQISVTNAGGLQLNGGNLHLYNEGGVTDFSTNGTYTLMNINGGFGGALSNLTVANPVAGKFYTLSNSPVSGVQLTIGTATTVNWNGNSNSSWSLGGNWVGGASPNAVGTSVRFNGGNLTGASSTTVSVDGGGKTASGIIFNDDSSSTSFSITGPGTLTLNNGVAAAAINVNGGANSISAPISATNSLSVSLANSSSLTVQRRHQRRQAAFRIRHRHHDFDRK